MTTARTGSTIAEVKPGSTRIYNFSAGPAVLPEEVLRAAQEAIWDFDGTGIGIMEHSHRGKAFDRVIQEAEADCRRIADIPDDYHVLFLQGGATTQFATVPMNFLHEGKTVDVPHTGEWTAKAIKEAKLFGRVNVAFDGQQFNFDHTPSDDELELTPDAAYLHYCSNNTIYGTRYEEPPTTDAPLVCDASSEMFSRPIDVGRHALIFAGAQKNLGPAGVTLVIIRKEFADRGKPGLASMFDYRKHADKGSCLNTPPTFAIYVMGQVFKWIIKKGGLAAIDAHNRAKAGLIYDALDASSEFYRCVAREDCRSLMNVTFRSPSEALDSKLIEESAKHGMDGLKGHRNTGGLRASIYNAFPKAGCEALAQLLRDFASRNG